jgi:hypothetical protein
MRTAFVIVLFLTIVILSGVSHAYTDEQPTIDIKVYNTENLPRNEVDTTAIIKVTGADEGFNAAVSSLQLLEDGHVLQLKKCFNTLKCEMSVNVFHGDTGQHTYTGIVIDAGSKSAKRTTFVKFRGIEQPPTLAFIDDIRTEEGSSITVDITANDINNDVVSITAKGLPRGATFANNKFEWTPNYTQSGSYSVVFTAVDSKNHKTSRTMKINVANRNIEPIVTYSDDEGKKMMGEGDKRTFYVNIFDPDKQAPKVEWWLDGRKVSSSRSYTYKPGFDDEGTHRLQVIVTDNTFVRTRGWTISVGDVNRAPSMEKIGDKEIYEGDSLKIRVYAKDPDDDLLTYTTENLPKGATFNPYSRLFEWKTENSDTGIYRVLFKVTDEKGLFDAKTITIKVRRVQETLDEKYNEALRLAEERMNLERQSQMQTQTQGTYQQFMPTVVSESCVPGYLCSTTTYLGSI